MTTGRHQGITARRCVATQGRDVVVNVSIYTARLVDIDARSKEEGAKREPMPRHQTMFLCRSEVGEDAMASTVSSSDDLDKRGLGRLGAAWWIWSATDIEVTSVLASPLEL